MLDLLTLDTKTLLKSALTRLHRHAFSNQAEIRRSTICRCFRCRSEFHRLAVVGWTVRTWRGQPVFPGPQPLDTAECPRCGQLAALGDGTTETRTRPVDVIRPPRGCRVRAAVPAEGAHTRARCRRP